MKNIYYNDLSWYDINGKLQETRESANCYVIHEPGEYIIPIVYGNALNNDPICLRGNITQPYIVKDYAKFLSDAFIRILNKDSSDDFLRLLGIETHTDIEESYIKFKVTKVPESGANYIIGIGVYPTIVWSWHIWLWKNELDTNTKLLNVNLGSKIMTTRTVNWYYQWGRKDPIFPFINRSRLKIKNKKETNNGINIPDYFITGHRNIEGNEWENNYKTIYDPCPRGYKVPNLKELKKYTKILPDTGRRESFQGLACNTDTGYYWALTEMKKKILIVQNGIYLYSLMAKASINSSLNSGFSIRPQKI